jgi:DNA-binding transcriptional LysR family regulator
LVPRLLREVADHGNAPSVRLVEGRLAEIGRQLETGEIDVLITMNTPSELGGLKLDGFRMEQVGSEQWTVVCSPDHPMARSGRPSVRSWKALAQADWILPPRPTNARIMVEQVMLKHGLAPIVPHIESMNAITHLQLAERGLGITLAAMCVVEDRLRRGLLVEIPMQDLPPPVPIVLVYRIVGARQGAVATLLAAAQRIRKADASVRSSSSARTRKLAPRKSRS